MIGVFLSPSSQPWNNCKMGDTEEQHQREIAFETKNYFDKDNRFKCVVCPEFFGMTEDQRLSEAVRLSDKFYYENGQNTWHIALHSDAYNAKVNGFSCFYVGDGSSKKLAEIFCKNFAKISPWGLRQLREYPGLKEMKTEASSILVETNFHDTVEGAKWIHDNKKKIALCVYQSACEAEGFKPLTFDEEKKPSTPPNTTVVTPPDYEKWKKDLVQECLDLKLLKDTAWIAKINDGMPVFAVCAMIIQLYKLYVKK